MSNYDKWLVKELKDNHCKMEWAAFPIIGWMQVVFMMSFYLPIKFLKAGGRSNG